MTMRTWVMGLATIVLITLAHLASGQQAIADGCAPCTRCQHAG